MADSGLSPAGSSTYSSNTFHAGDGTWDGQRDSYLLPNLVGLNFATMQYNGMGNRFRGLTQYHTLILGHGILAAIVFIGIVPAAIFLAKYGHRAPRLSLKLHVYLQVLTVLLTTVILILGWFAVGPERSLTNPHHGIGVAIYTLVLVQFFWGWLMFKAERKRKVQPTKTPKKIYIHRILGRTIAVLGFVQIALGLTLYGSPKALFILYALAGALLLFLYLALDYHYKQRVGAAGSELEGSEYYSDYTGSYLSGSRTDYTQDHGRRTRPQPERRESESHWGRKLLAGAGALGAYEAWKHRRNQRRDERLDERTETDSRYDSRSRRHPETSTMLDGSSRPPPGDSTLYGPSTRPPLGASTMTPQRYPSRSRRTEMSESRLSPQSWEDEKYSESPRRHTWRDRILGAGAGFAAFEGVKGLFNRRKRDKDYVDPNYRPPLGGNQNMVSQTDVSRVQNGQAPFSPGDPRRNERVNMAAASSHPPVESTLAPTSMMTPTRPPRGARPSTDMYSYDSRESFDDEPLHDDNEPHTLRDSIAAFGAIGGFKAWNNRRKQKREDQRIDMQRRQEMENAERFNRRTSARYPMPQDGRRASFDESVVTGMTNDPGRGSNPELSRTTFNSRPNTNVPPLPANASTLPPSSLAPTTAPLSASRQNVTADGYVLPPPPPGPPPNMANNAMHAPPVPGSAHMPAGAVDPDPSRLLQQNTAANESSAYGRTNNTDPTNVTGPSTGAATMATSSATGAALGAAAASHPAHSQQSLERSQFRQREDSRTRRAARRNSQSSVSAVPPSDAPTSPVRVKMHMHNDSGGHVTLQRLPDEENNSTFAASSAARRAERRQQRRARRNSDLSSGLESDATPGANRRYRRKNPASNDGTIRASSQQPITNVPPPPASGVGSHRPPSELNLPPPPRVPTHSNSPQSVGQQVAGSVGSPQGPQALGYGTETGTGTDVSAFDSNRRRRRAERARRQQGARVEFE